MKRRAQHANVKRSTIRVLELDRRGVAAVVIDPAPELNAFGLCNRCQLVPLGEEPLRHCWVRLLLAEAVRSAAVRNVLQLVLLHDDLSQTEAIQRAGFRYVSPALHWIGSAGIVPDWQEHVRRFFTAYSTTRR